MTLTLTLTLAGCGHRQEQQPAEVPDSCPQEQVGAATTDTMSPAKRQALMKDETTRTDLRLFGRKEMTLYTEQQLCGEWVMGTVHELYCADGTGRQWDTSEDVRAEEAQNFIWVLDSNRLHEVYRLQMGGAVPREYVVTFVDDETLVYKDSYDRAYLWDRVKDPAQAGK